MPSFIVRYDVPNWAFFRRAIAMHRYRRPGDRVVIASNDQYHGGLADGDYDVAFLCDMTDSFGSREKCTARRVVRFVGSHGWMYDKYDPNDWRTKGVNGRNARTAKSIVQENCNAVCVHSEEQKRFFDTIHERVHVMSYPVDTRVFTPGPGKRPGRKLRVGWCGQLGGGEANFKGFVEVFIPVVARLGESVEWSVNHRDHRTALTAPQLAKWYQSLDVFLCTSTAEGGPQTVFEAAACGCIVLSTLVGQVADWKTLVDMGLTTPPPANEVDAGRVIDWFARKLGTMTPSRVDEVGPLLVRSIRAEHAANLLVPRHLELIACR